MSRTTVRHGRTRPVQSRRRRSASCATPSAHLPRLCFHPAERCVEVRAAVSAALGACVCCRRTLASWRVRAARRLALSCARLTRMCRRDQGYLRRWRASPRGAFWRGRHALRGRPSAPPRCSRLCGQPPCNVAVASHCIHRAVGCATVRCGQHVGLEASRHPARHATPTASTLLALPTAAGQATELSTLPSLRV